MLGETCSFLNPTLVRATNTPSCLPSGVAVVMQTKPVNDHDHVDQRLKHYDTLHDDVLASVVYPVLTRSRRVYYYTAKGNNCSTTGESDLSNNI